MWSNILWIGSSCAWWGDQDGNKKGIFFIMLKSNQITCQKNSNMFLSHVQLL